MNAQTLSERKTELEKKTSNLKKKLEGFSKKEKDALQKQNDELKQKLKEEQQQSLLLSAQSIQAPNADALTLQIELLKDSIASYVEKYNLDRGILKELGD